MLQILVVCQLELVEIVINLVNSEFGLDITPCKPILNLFTDFFVLVQVFLFSDFYIFVSFRIAVI